MGSLGRKSPSTVDQQSVVVNGTPIQIYFSPEDHALDHMIPGGLERNYQYSFSGI